METLQAKMGEDATQMEVIVMTSLIQEAGYSVDNTTEIPESLWLAMLNEAVRTALHLTETASYAAFS